MKKILTLPFDKISAVYDFLDEHAFIIERDSDITTAWLQFKEAALSPEEKQQAQWELEAFLFSFHGDKIFSFSYSNGTTIGEISRYPLLDEYQKGAFDYLKQRLSSAKSPLLLARYNHLLWKGVAGKNFSYAAGAINNYIQCIADYYSIVTKQDDPSKNQFYIGQCAEKALALANETKKQLNGIIELVQRLLFRMPAITFHTKMGVIEDMLNYSRIFKSGHFSRVLDLVSDGLNNTAEPPEDFLLVNHYLPAAIKVAQKTGSDVKPWFNRVGEAHLRLAEEQVGVDRNWIKLNIYSEGIAAFRKAGNHSKKKEVEQLYSQLRPNVALDNFELPFDEDARTKMKALQEELQQKAHSLLKHHPYDIYTTLAIAKLLPSRANVDSITKTFETGFLQFVKTVTFDNNKNVSGAGADDDYHPEFFRTYGLLLREQFLPYLHYVIVLGIKRGLLTYDSFIGFLVQHSWIGKTNIVYDLGNHPEETNWIKLIAPAIVNYFEQVQAWGESKYFMPNFVLCTDSLVLKMEGIFRNLCEKLNIATAVGKQQGMQEILLNNIIDNDDVKKHFSEEDWLLFEYVLANKGGLNLRNNIAHSFYTENHYAHDLVLLLLAILLKLSQVKIAAP